MENQELAGSGPGAGEGYVPLVFASDFCFVDVLICACVQMFALARFVFVWFYFRRFFFGFCALDTNHQLARTAPTNSHPLRHSKSPLALAPFFVPG